MKTALTLSRVLALTVVLFVCFAVAAAVAGLSSDPAQTDPGAAVDPAKHVAE